MIAQAIAPKLAAFLRANDAQRFEMTRQFGAVLRVTGTNKLQISFGTPAGLRSFQDMFRDPEAKGFTPAFAESLKPYVGEVVVGQQTVAFTPSPTVQ